MKVELTIPMPPPDVVITLTQHEATLLAMWARDTSDHKSKYYYGSGCANFLSDLSNLIQLKANIIL